MILYHGTSKHAGDQLLVSEPRRVRRPYFGNMEAFCTTESFKIAELFAFRRSPPAVLQGDWSEAGVVVEYVLCPAIDGQTFFRTRDHATMQNEKEVLVPAVHHLIVTAIHRLDTDVEWQRIAMEAVR